MSQLGEDLTNIIASFNELGPGVPASDRVCQALLAVLTTQWQQTHYCGVETPWVFDEEAQSEYELQFKISADFTLELSRSERENQHGSWKPMLEARFRRQAQPSGQGIAPVLTDAFTPEGLRKVLGLAKMYAKDLRSKGSVQNAKVSTRTYASLLLTFAKSAASRWPLASHRTLDASASTPTCGNELCKDLCNSDQLEQLGSSSLVRLHLGEVKLILHCFLRAGCSQWVFPVSARCEYSL